MSSIRLAQIWALLGFCLLLGYAVFRLFGHFLDSWSLEYHWYHWVLLAVNTFFMAYSEGYKGFQKSYSIKFAGRLKQLETIPSSVKLLLAPLFCMNYFAATKKDMILAYVLTVAIIVLVIVFSFIPQPWRGILDLGVVVGLTYGIIATILISIFSLFDFQQGSNT